MVTVNKIRNAQRSHGPTVILAISTATPPNFISQADYPDFYLRITNSDHMTDLKEKFKRMCMSLRHLYILFDHFYVRSLFGDGASSLIIGADPDTSVERPIFQLVSAAQTILPDSDEAIKLHLREAGLTFHLLKYMPEIIANNIEGCLVEAFSPIGINDWTSIFWIVHPGGQAILDLVEAKLGLQKEKLKVSRHILSEYGNMTSACVLFILDEMRKKSLREAKPTTGEGLEWGVLFGYGPGVTVETVVLHSVPVEAGDH